MKNEHLNILLLFPAFTLLTTVSIEKSSSVLIIHSSLYEMGVRPRLAGAFYYFIIIQFHKHYTNKSEGDMRPQSQNVNALDSEIHKKQLKD